MTFESPNLEPHSNLHEQESISEREPVHCKKGDIIYLRRQHRLAQVIGFRSMSISPEHKEVYEETPSFDGATHLYVDTGTEVVTESERQQSQYMGRTPQPARIADLIEINSLNYKMPEQWQLDDPDMNKFDKDSTE